MTFDLLTPKLVSESRVSLTTRLRINCNLYRAFHSGGNGRNGTDGQTDRQTVKEMDGMQDKVAY